MECIGERDENDADLVVVCQKIYLITHYTSTSPGHSTPHNVPHVRWSSNDLKAGPSSA